MSKWIISLICLLLALFVGTLYYVGRFSAEAEHSVAKAQLGNISRTARGTGKVEGVVDPVPLSFTQPGRLKTVRVEEGQSVQQGDLLAELDTTAVDLEIDVAAATLRETLARKEQQARKANAEEVLQLQEKVERADLEVKAAEVRLKNLDQPAPPPAAPGWRIQDAAREVERTAHVQREAAFQHLLLTTKTPSKDQLAVALARVHLAEVDLDDATKKFEIAKADKFPASYGVIPRWQQSEIEMNIERMRKKLELARADYDLLNHGPSDEEKQIAAARTKGATSVFDQAVAAKERLEHPPAPSRAAEAEIELARLSLAQAQSAKRETESALKRLKALPNPEDLAAAQAAVERAEKVLAQAKERRAQAVLKAPMDGTVLGRYFEPGSTPAPYAPVLTIGDLAHLRIRAEVPVKWAPDLKPGQVAVLSSLALPNAGLKGKIARVMGVVGPKTLFSRDPSEAQGGEVAVITIALDPPEALNRATQEALRPGMRLEVEIAFETRENVLIVPKGFIMHDRGQPLVYKAASANGPTQEVHVELGFNDGVNVEIRNGGLGEGDTIVKPRFKR